MPPFAPSPSPYGGSPEERRSRWLALAASGLIEAGLIAVVVLGLAGPERIQSGVTQALAAFNLTPPPPPEAPKPPPHHAVRPAGSSAPAAARAHAAPVEAPKVAVPLPRPVPAATHAAQGTALANGAALAGAGSGAGGTGAGTGSGLGGEGDGDGGDAEWIKGEIRDSDYPDAARQARAEGTTATRIAIGADGRPTGCTVRHSSGNAALDETTCRLVLKRFRFRPAADAYGQPRADWIDYDQEWSLRGFSNG